MSLEKRAFGNTGLTVSALGFGGAPVGFLEAEQEQVSRMLGSLLDQGVNLIDTAAMYAGSEELIGRAIAHRRSEYVLVTKAPNAMTDGEDCWSKTKLQASVERSLRRLRTERLDVVLLHSCEKDVLERGEALAALLDLQRAGKVGFVGYSGDGDTAAYALTLPGISVLETSISICDQANLNAVVPAAQKRGTGVIAKRSIANGAWKPLSAQKGIYAEYAKAYAERFSAMGLTLADLGLDGAPEAVWPEVALRFTLSQPGVHCAIVGTCSLTHTEGNLRAVSRGPLSDRTVAAIREAFRRAEARSGAVWLAET